MKSVTIIIGVDQYHHPRKVTEAEAAALPEGTTLTRLADDSIAVRESVAEPSETTIIIEGEQIERMLADNRAIGGTASVERLIADHIERTVMPHHSDQQHWNGVRVADAGDLPDLEKVLAGRFDIAVLEPPPPVDEKETVTISAQDVGKLEIK